MSEFSCKGCKNRKLNCHSTCNTYLKEKEEHNKLQNSIRNSLTFFHYKLCKSRDDSIRDKIGEKSRICASKRYNLYV